jgi:hypothetical protein
VDSGFVVLGGPLADKRRVVLAIEAESEDAVRATLARDPWSGTHLLVDMVEPWTSASTAEAADSLAAAPRSQGRSSRLTASQPLGSAQR